MKTKFFGHDAKDQTILTIFDEIRIQIQNKYHPLVLSLFVSLLILRSVEFRSNESAVPSNVVPFESGISLGWIICASDQSFCIRVLIKILVTRGNRMKELAIRRDVSRTTG